MYSYHRIDMRNARDVLRAGKLERSGWRVALSGPYTRLYYREKPAAVVRTENKRKEG